MPPRALQPASFLAGTAIVALVGCAGPPPLPSVELEAKWDSAVGATLAQSALSQPARERIAAYAALASYEAHASDTRSGLRSLAGQLNGLWSFPVSPGQVDGAIAAAAAQRALLDTLIGAPPHAAARLDALADSITSDRRARGVSRALAERSMAHGVALGMRLFEWAASGQQTFVLRHARECTAPPQRGAPPRSQPPVTLAGGTMPAPAASVAEASERRLIATITRADLAASIAPVEDCVGERVRARLRTRPPTS